MRIGITVLLAVLSASAADIPAELFNRVEAIRQAGRRFGNELWPGWDPTATPLAIHKRGEMAVLVGHPKPPAGFQPNPTPLVSAPVFVSSSTQGMVLANTAAPFGGVLTSFIGYNSLMDPPNKEDAVALGLHELFHAHERKISPQKFGNVLVFLWGDYPEFSAKNRVMLGLEAEALYRAAKATDPADVQRHAAEFLGLRQERRKDVSKEAAQFESGEESNEGLCNYIEYRVLDAAYPQRTDLRDKRLQALMETNNLPRVRDRFYPMGMAIALVLDRLRPGWKKEFETTDALLDELLAKSVTPQPVVRDLGAMIYNQKQALDKRADEGSRRLGVLLNSGFKVTVEIGDRKNSLQLRGFDPYGAVQLTPDHVAYTYLVLEMPGTKLEFAGVPVIYEKLQDVFWCIVPEETVQEALKKMDGEKLVLAGKGFRLEFEKMEINQRGRELRIKPATDLKRSPALEKMKVLKPEKQ